MRLLWVIGLLPHLLWPKVSGDTAACAYLCTEKDNISSGVWERIDGWATDAADLESMGGYVNHTFSHLPNWAPHFCSRTQEEFVRAHESFLWRWRPHTCDLYDFRPVGSRSFSVYALLQKLGAANIVFAGDSIAAEQYMSLEAMLGKYITNATLEHVMLNSKLHTVPIASFRTTTGLQVYYARNDLLVADGTLLIDEPTLVAKVGGLTTYHYTVNQTRLGPQSPERHSTPYAHLLEYPNTHLVLATSPHYGRGRGKGVEVYRAMVQNVIAHLQQHFRGERVYVRSTVAGHPNCQHAQAPYTDKLYKHDPVWHNWAEFDSHNQAWREALATLGDDRFVFLDIEPLTRARPDGHLKPNAPDCLHYCLPGTIDYWNLALASFWMSCKA